MRVEFSLFPPGGSTRACELLSEAIGLVSRSGPAYRLTLSGIRVEGGRDEVMNIVRRCHD